MPIPVSRVVLPLLILTSASPALAASSASDTGAAAAKPARTTSQKAARITVTGVGEATGKPDMAMTSFSVVAEAPMARAALDEANQSMERVTAGLKELGIEARDLQTSGFSIEPQYSQEEHPKGKEAAPPRIVGYLARNTLSIRIRKVDDVGKVLDRAVSLGANQGGDIAFSIDDPTALQAEARRKAVEDAMAAARTLAAAAGGSLGPVVSIVEQGGRPQPLPMARSMKFMDAAASGSVPVETGESTIRTEVRMVFQMAR